MVRTEILLVVEDSLLAKVLYHDDFHLSIGILIFFDFFVFIVKISLFYKYRGLILCNIPSLQIGLPSDIIDAEIKFRNLQSINLMMQSKGAVRKSF